jgi:hypothetical protein
MRTLILTLSVDLCLLGEYGIDVQVLNSGCPTSSTVVKPDVWTVWLEHHCRHNGDKLISDPSTATAEISSLRLRPSDLLLPRVVSYGYFNLYYSERKFSSTLHNPSTPQASEPLLVRI